VGPNGDQQPDSAVETIKPNGVVGIPLVIHSSSLFAKVG